MTLSSAAYSYEAAASGDEGRHSNSQSSHKYPECSATNGNTCNSKSNKKKRFSLLRRLSSKKSNKDRENKKAKKIKNHRFNPESSTPAIWPSKANRRRSSLESDMSGHTWLSSGTNGSSSRSLAAGDCPTRSSKERNNRKAAVGPHSQMSDRRAHEQEEGAAAADNANDDNELFQDSLGDLSAALPGLDLQHDSRSRLPLRFSAGSDCANDGSHRADTSSEEDGDDEIFRTAHGEDEGMAERQYASDDDVDGMSSDEDVTASFLSCIAEVAEGPHTTNTTTGRRKSVEFKDVASYATVTNKRFLSDDELFVLFYSVEEETELRKQLKSQIRAARASPNPDRTHPTFCSRGVEHYFLPREGKQARLADQQNVIDSVLDEQHVQYCERGAIHDDSAIAIASMEASRDARLDALERGGRDETEVILIRREDEAAGTLMKQDKAVRIHQTTLDGSILKGKHRVSYEGALCA